MKYIKLIWSFFKIRRNTKKSRKQIKKLQEEKLRELLLYTFDHSKYYRETFEKAGITREQIPMRPLSDFPTIDKTLFMEHFNKLVTVDNLCQEQLRSFNEAEGEHQEKFKDQYHVVHSSGSTGKPGFFVYDDKAWNQMLIGIIRAALWDMTNLQVLKFLASKPKVAYIAATDGRYGGAMAVGGGIDGLHMERLFLDIKMPLTEWIASIKDFKPNIIIGYPSAIKILGELVEKGQVTVDIMRIISCGEPLGSHLRSYMKTIFKADIINIYGASESLILGVESEHSDGMYLFDDMNYIEVESENIYLTSLYNRVQPLIRYKISDQLVLKEADEENSYPFTRVQSIVGRNEDLIWFEGENGTRDFLHPLAIEGFCIEGLIDYQFKKVSSNQFQMIAEVPDKKQRALVESEMQRSMKQILEEKKLEYVRFDMRFTDCIMPDPATGKKRLIAT